MRIESLNRLVDRGSDSNAYHIAIHGYPGNGDENVHFENLGMGPTTLGLSMLAQTISHRWAEFINSCDASATFSSDPAIASAVFHERVTLTVEEPELPPIAPRNRELTRDVDRLIAIIESEPIEDGVTHPGEEHLANIIAKHGTGAFVTIIGETRLLALSAAFIRLLARVNRPPQEIRLELIARTISSDSVEIRDAIVQAVELWEDHEAVQLLAGHQESIPWLAEYISLVLNELGG